MTWNTPPRRYGRPVAVLLTLILLLTSTAGVASAQFAAYWGKNRVKYDKFAWHIYTTDHFDIYYYPELEEHLERVASYAESAYQQISADLRHDLAFSVPLIVFKTHSEFEQQNLVPGAVPEGVAAFAEPQRNRIVLPIDEPPDGLYRLITHELTHIFEFDIIPRSIIRQSVPLWVDEGLADFMAGVWRPLDLMTVRDVAIGDVVPSMTEFEGYGGFANARVVYNLGHAVFEFIEDEWGLEGLRQFLFALRRNAIGGGEDPYDEAFDLDAEEWDDAFKSYLDDRFEAFREKERPTDYGRNLAPDPLRSRYPVVYSLEASPTGEVIAALGINRRDREADIVLLSSRTGDVILNLTEGFDQDFGFEYITQPGGLRWNTVPWMSWAPTGDQLVYMVRNGKGKSLAIHNVVTREIEQVVDLDMVDEPESPDFGPDGRSIVFSALRNGVGDIYEIDLATHEVVNLTNSAFADYAPFYSPDGRSIIHISRVSGNDKLFRLDRETGVQTQLTFGTHDDAGGQFIDDRTIVFASTAIDPAEPLDPETARDGEILNIWTLDLENGALRQLTDNATGVVNPVVLSPDEGSSNPRIGFVTYFKAEYGLHTIEYGGDPILEAMTADFGGPGPLIDFQAPLGHALNLDNQRRKGRFEDMYLQGAPNFGVGVNSNGDLLGGTVISFADVLGDQQFNIQAYSVETYRTYGASYVNLAGRLQFALQGISSEQYFYGLGAYYAPTLGFLDRDDAIATRRSNGGSAIGIYPLNRFQRLEMSAGIYNYKERYANDALRRQSDAFEQAQFGTNLFRDGSFMPFGVRFVQETTIFREYGPLKGNSIMLGYEYAPSVGNFLSRQTIDLDARYYARLAANGVLAFRGRAFRSWGEFPDFFFFGGQSEMRGYDYLHFLGHKAFHGNMELRFPLIEAMATPIGILGGVRGTFFFNFGVAAFDGQPWNMWSRDPAVVRPATGYVENPFTGAPELTFGPPVAVSGFRLNNARASYGFGLTTFAIGFPIHLDWSWPTLFNREWENAVFAQEAQLNGFINGSDYFRRVRFQLWIGYDF